jgi:hypothetical protein
MYNYQMQAMHQPVISFSQIEHTMPEFEALAQFKHSFSFKDLKRKKNMYTWQGGIASLRMWTCC